MPVLVGVLGLTGSGKTALAEALADELNAELINADAFQIYRGMDVGTAKPTAKNRYRLLDIKNVNETFGVGEFVQLAANHLKEIWSEDRSAVVVGGTGLYVRALFEEYSTMSAAPEPGLRERLNRMSLVELVQELKEVEPATTVDLRNPVRVKRAIERARTSDKTITVDLPPYVKVKLGLVPELAGLEAILKQRVEAMVQNGWVREVEALRTEGYGPDDPGFRAIGYRTMWRHLEGQISLDEAMAITIAETRRYAKRQRTWLRTEPGLNVLNLTGGNPVQQTLELIPQELR